MERLTHERVNGIKTGYWSAATKEVLVQKLAAYENTGYEPDEIRAAIEQAAKSSETKTATVMAERKITLTIELTPDDERRTIGVSVTAKSTLAATNPVATALYVTSDGNGELVVAEMVPQVPGQMNMDGTQQEAPKLLKLVQHG